jgi:hypothetical protein
LKLALDLDPVRCDVMKQRLPVRERRAHSHQCGLRIEQTAQCVDVARVDRIGCGFESSVDLVGPMSKRVAQVQIPVVLCDRQSR